MCIECLRSRIPSSTCHRARSRSDSSFCGYAGPVIVLMTTASSLRPFRPSTSIMNSRTRIVCGRCIIGFIVDRLCVASRRPTPLDNVILRAELLPLAEVNMTATVGNGNHVDAPLLQIRQEAKTTGNNGRQRTRPHGSCCRAIRGAGWIRLNLSRHLSCREIDDGPGRQRQRATASSSGIQSPVLRRRTEYSRRFASVSGMLRPVPSAMNTWRPFQCQASCAASWTLRPTSRAMRIMADSGNRLRASL